MPLSIEDRELRRARDAHFTAVLDTLNDDFNSLQGNVGKLLAFRQEVATNDPPIFELPADLDRVDQRLAEKRAEMVAYVNGLPGGP